MLLHGVLFVIAGLLLAADAPKVADAEKIQGTWKITREVENGKESPKERNEKVRIRFTADKMIVSEGDEKQEATYKLDTGKKPPTIEVVPSQGPNRGKKARGIYQFDGEMLRICLVLHPAKEAPTDFNAPADSGRVLLTLQRVKP